MHTRICRSRGRLSIRQESFPVREETVPSEAVFPLGHNQGMHRLARL